MLIIEFTLLEGSLEAYQFSIASDLFDKLNRSSATLLRAILMAYSICSLIFDL